MKTEVIIETINGNKKSIRNYAYTIAEMSEGSTNAYVMAFDSENEILWTVQAGDGVETAEDVINWDGVKRVEIYDHSADMAAENAAKTEFVYISTVDSFTQYLNERAAADYEVVYNTTGKDARFAAADQDSTDQDDTDQDDTDQDNTDQDNTDDTDQDNTNNRVQVADSIKSAAQAAGYQVAQVARRTAFVACLIAVWAISMAAALAPMYLFADLCASWQLSSLARLAVGVVVMFGPALDLSAWIVTNCMVIVRRIFPDFLTAGELSTFVAPFSVLGRLAREIRRRA